MNSTDDSGSRALTWALLGALLLAGLVIAIVLLRPSRNEFGPNSGASGEVLRVDEDVTPERFRKEGQSYSVKVAMNLKGQAQHADWGLESALHVNYVVTLRYNETVLESKPDRLLVERHILELRHRLFSSVEAIDLSQDMKALWSMLDYVAFVEPRISQGAKAIGEGAASLRDRVLAETRRRELNWGPLLEKIGKDPAQALKTLASSLEGRKVKLLWTRGEGVSIFGGAEGLSQEDKRLLERASLLADGALFPNKSKRLGERWDVDARHFNDFLDIGLDGSLRGKVAIRRGEDCKVEGQDCASLELVGGLLDVVRDDESREARGSVEPQGLLRYDLAQDLIVSGELHGKAKAQFSSKDHLLFQARFKGTPSFVVSYEARIR